MPRARIAWQSLWLSGRSNDSGKGLGRRQKRTHECSECGLVLHRDTAAAQVILGRMCPLDAKIGEPIPCLV